MNGELVYSSRFSKLNLQFGKKHWCVYIYMRLNALINNFVWRSCVKGDGPLILVKVWNISKLCAYPSSDLPKINNTNDYKAASTHSNSTWSRLEYIVSYSSYVSLGSSVKYLNYSRTSSFMVITAGCIPIHLNIMNKKVHTKAQCIMHKSVECTHLDTIIYTESSTC